MGRGASFAESGRAESDESLEAYDALVDRCREREADVVACAIDERCGSWLEHGGPSGHGDLQRVEAEWSSRTYTFDGHGEG